MVLHGLLLEQSFPSLPSVATKRAAPDTGVSLLTVIEKEFKDVDVLPSLTLIAMFRVDPTSPALGVPVSEPVVVLNVAQLGLLEIENVRASPSASFALGWNE
jgi:hypothetical protein